MQQQLGDQYSELAANEGYMKTLRQQVLNRLIDEALLDQYARELKLGISDEQVKQAIFATPAFQVDGKFDNSRYNGILNQMGMTANQVTTHAGQYERHDNDTENNLEHETVCSRA